MGSKEFRLLMEAIDEVRRHLQMQQAVPKDEEFLDSHRMERLLKCSPSKLYRLRKSGAIPCVLVGGRYLYPKHFFTQEVIRSIVKEDVSKRFDE
jgi:hypothetical protein